MAEKIMFLYAIIIDKINRFCLMQVGKDVSIDDHFYGYSFVLNAFNKMCKLFLFFRQIYLNYKVI